MRESENTLGDKEKDTLQQIFYFIFPTRKKELHICPIQKQLAVPVKWYSYDMLGTIGRTENSKPCCLATTRCIRYGFVRIREDS